MRFVVPRLSWLVLVVVMSWTGAAGAEENAEPVYPDVPTTRERTVASLPEDRYITDLVKPAFLKLGPAPVVTLSEVEEADADIVIRPMPCEDDCKTMTMVQFQSATPGKVKVDVWISPDGERWYYTSSCPFGSTFESWPHPIPYLAIARPRAEPADSHVCR